VTEALVRGGVVWASPGKNAETFKAFFKSLEKSAARWRSRRSPKSRGPTERGDAQDGGLHLVRSGAGQHRPQEAPRMDRLGRALPTAPVPEIGAHRHVRSHIEGIIAYVATGLSNGRSEGLNGKIRTITRGSFGFHGPTSLIALIFLCCSGITLLPVHK